MRSSKRPNAVNGVTKGDVLPGDRRVSGKHYRRDGIGVIRRKFPKLRGTAAVKKAKRDRVRRRLGQMPKLAA